MSSAYALGLLLHLASFYNRHTLDWEKQTGKQRKRLGILLRLTLPLPLPLSQYSQ
jgi:hypothetical protein